MGFNETEISMYSDLKAVNYSTFKTDVISRQEFYDSSEETFSIVTAEERNATEFQSELNVTTSGTTKEHSCKNVSVNNASLSGESVEVKLNHSRRSFETEVHSYNLPTLSSNYCMKESNHYDHKLFTAYSSVVRDCYLSKEMEESLTKCLTTVCYLKQSRPSKHSKRIKDTVWEIVNKLQKDVKSLLPLHCKNLHVFSQGNTFHGLCVKDGKEFDIYIRLGRPFLPRKMHNAKVDIVSFADCNASARYPEGSYKIPVVKYLINMNHLTTLMPGISIFLDSNNGNIVSADKFHAALYFVLEYYLVSYNSQRTFSKQGIQSISVKKSSSGALVILNFKKQRKAVMNLIFCINISRSSDPLKWLNLPIPYSKQLKEQWLYSGASISYLVPHDNQLWYVDFNPLLKSLFSSKGCLRTVLHLLNAVWEKGGWDKVLPNKYLLTVIVLQYKFCCEKKIAKSNELGKHFFIVLCLLRKCVEDKVLVDIFMEKKNLLKHLREEDAKMLSSNIGHIIKCIEQDPLCVIRYL